MKKSMSVPGLLLFVSFLIIFPFKSLVAQEKLPENAKKDAQSISSAQHVKSAKNALSKGTILYSFPLNQTRDPQGVTVVNDTIIIASSDGHGNNYFDTYDYTGHHYREVREPATSTWGYRDLAFDGHYILASDDTTIKKISPVDFTVVSSINNSGNNPNRGLAYDANEHVIYSSNYKRHILKIDPATGATLKTLNRPLENVYGLAIDTYSNPAYASLWFTEPSKHGVYRLSRADTSNVNINYTIDLSEAAPDSAYSGGLEIINNHPAYPSRIIALMTDQYNKRLNFVDITDIPYSLPTTLEDVGEFGGYEIGVWTSGMIQYDKYLYSVGNDKLRIYDINTNPAHPALIKSIDVPHGNRIFLEGNWGDHIIITTKNNHVYGFVAYRLSDPLNPQLLSETQTRYPIVDMKVGSFSYVVEEGSDSLFVYYMGSYTKPYIQAKYKLVGEGLSLVKDDNGHLLFVGNSGNLSSNRGVTVFDNSNPNKLIEKSHKGLNGDFPQRLIALTDVKKLIVGVNWLKGDHSSLYCFDYSDPANVKFVALVILSFKAGIWDMKLISNILYVSVPDDGKVLTYQWDDYSHLFLTGSSIADLVSPIDIIGYHHAVSSGSIKNSFLGNYEQYIFVPNGYASGTIVTGSEKTKVIRAKTPAKTIQKTLTMSIMPPTAVGYNCSVIPAEGKHSYAKGTEINVYAVPNPKEGWYFTGWSGSVSGKDLIKQVVMDADKSATAHFDELLLTVSGKKDLSGYCPNEIIKHPHVFHLPITVTASLVDDWQLQKISLRSKGSGDEQKDISGVEVYLGTTKRYSGKFSADNGKLAVSFTPPISIGAGESVTLNLYYNFGFDPKTYVTDTTKSFYVETFGTVAKPVHYDEGKIAGNAVHDYLTFARIYNTQGYGFSTIQDAVDANTTKSGDSCIVCAGNYNESVELGFTHGRTKPVVIFAKEGPDKTVIVPIDDKPAFLIELGNNCEVNGFSIQTDIDPYSYNYKEAGIRVEFGKESRIIGNRISFFHNGIVSGGADSTQIMNNTIKFSDKNFILATNANHYEIANNTFSGVPFEAPVIHVFNGFGHLIHGNKAIGGDMMIKLVKVKKSDVYKNEGHIMIQGRRRIFLDNCENILIEHNKNIDIVAELTGYVSINDNDLGHVILKGYCNDVVIMDNVIHNGEMGISITGASEGIYKGLRPMHNMIIGNKITNTEFCTIHLDGATNTTIKDNDIYDNPSAIGIDNSEDLLFENNTVRGNRYAGLYLNAVTRGKVIGNVFSDNATGIVSKFVKEVTFANNLFINNHGSHTGLHAYHSDISITGNQISGNSGGGIKLAEGSRADISYNNIYSNEEVQIENQDNTISSDVSNNFWGSPTGPASGDMAGNLSMNGFLKDTVRVVLSPASDTIRVTAGSEDSVDIFMNNFVNPADHLKVTVKDEKGWIEPLPKEVFELDSLGAIFPVKFSIPATIGDSVFDKVTISCYSTYDTSYKASDTFVLASYIPKILHFSIFPDSSTVHFGDSLKFSVSGQDQYSNAITVSPTWKTSRGKITADGVFTSDSTEGVIEISAVISEKKMTAITKVYNTHQKVYFDRIAIRPDSVKLLPGGEMAFSSEGFNQFGFPNSIEKVWSATGGKISSFGFYKADSVPGIYHIVVQDIDSIQGDTAVVIIEDVTGVEETDAASSDITLLQNYPNPFHNRTQIRFTLPKPANVWLSVFDINGREVVRLLKTRKPAGTYRLTFDASRLPAGTYFYRLQAGGYVQVKKMILLK